MTLAAGVGLAWAPTCFEVRAVKLVDTRVMKTRLGSPTGKREKSTLKGKKIGTNRNSCVTLESMQRSHSIINTLSKTHTQSRDVGWGYMGVTLMTI